MDEHHPDDGPHDLAHLGAGDGADSAATVEPDDDPGAHSGPDDEPGPAWVPGTDVGIPSDQPDGDPSGPESWVGGESGPGVDGPLDGPRPEPSIELPQDSSIGRDEEFAAEPIELPAAHDDPELAAESGEDLPGLAPPDELDTRASPREGPALAGPLEDVLAFDTAGDTAGGDADDDTELVFEGELDALLDGDGDGDDATDARYVLRFDDDSFDVSDLSEGNGDWSAAAVISALGLSVGASALAVKLTSGRRLRQRGAVDAVEQLEDAGADARIEHGDLHSLERALASGDRVLVTQIAGPASGHEWVERALVVCAIDRSNQRVLLAPAESAHRAAPDRVGGAELRASSSMALAIFIGSWADSAGEMIIVESTPESPRSFVLPIAVTDGLLRPVEDS